MHNHRTSENYLLSSYNYHLPPELIAQEPAHPRDSSRLMVCDPTSGNSGDSAVDHRTFRELDTILSSGDVLVINDSRVIPARVKGLKSTGGKSEVLFLNPLDDDSPLEALIRGRVREGTVIDPIGSRHPDQRIKIRRHISEGRYEVMVNGTTDMSTFLHEVGELPVPPYIKKPLLEQENYQTVYSGEPGSVAAPTAGLHFTNDLLHRLERRGVQVMKVTLHVSIGTFLPVRDNDIRNHTMEPEYFMLGNSIKDAIEADSKMIAVGTTVVKTLESAYQVIEGNSSNSWGGSGPGGGGETASVPKSSRPRGCSPLRTEGWSDLFIYPGHRFFSPLKGMITNFHLPSSTLIMLISAYAGRDRILGFYEQAVKERYRFYSFGDAMFLNGPPVPP